MMPLVTDHCLSATGGVQPLGGGAGLGLPVIGAGAGHLHKELPQLADVISKGVQWGGRVLLALLDEVPEAHAVHELVREGRKALDPMSTVGSREAG